MMRRFMVVVVGLSVLSVVACSGGQPMDEEATTPAPATELSIQVEEFHFSPAIVAIPAGEQVTVTVGNTGTIDHEWVIIDKGHEVDGDHRFSENAVLFEVDHVGEGTRSTSTFTVAIPGRYQLICAIEGHLAAGMEATLVVV